MLISGHLCLLCIKNTSYVLKSHKSPHMTIFLQNLIARCYIPIVKGNCPQLFGQKKFRLGVVQKLRGQDEVGRWSKNASFCPRLG